MSATSSGSGKRDNASPPGAMGSSTKETGEGTEGNVCNACENQAHSTTHCTQCKTNPNLTGESEMSTSAQSQSKGEINISDGKLADDNEKGEKNKITPREQDKVVNNAMQRAQNNNPSSYNVQDENVCAEKGRGLIVATVADQLGQNNSSRNAQADKVTLENFEKNEKHMVAEAAANADHKTETGEHTRYENNKQMYQEDDKRSASPKQTLEQRNDTPSKSESVNLNQGNEKPTTPPTAKGLQSAPQTENPNQGNGMPSTLQTENSHQGNGTPSTLQAKNPDQVNGTQSTPQTENSDPGDGTPSTPQMEIQNQGNGTLSALQAKNPDQGNGTPSTPQTEILNQKNGKPSTSQTEILNQENGKPSTSQTEIQNQGNGTPSILQTENSHQGDSTPSALQAKNPDQGNGTPSTPQTEILNQGNSIPSTSQTENPNQRDGRPRTRHTEIQNQGNGTPSTLQANNPTQGDGSPSILQTENSHQGNGTPSALRAKNPDQGNGTLSTPQIEIQNQGNGTPSILHTTISNQGNGIPLAPQTENLIQGNGTPSTPHTEIQNQGNGTPSIIQGNNLTQEDNAPSSSQAENSHQGDSTPSALQAKNPDQGNGIPLAPQTENLIQGNGTPSTPHTEIQNQGNGTPSIIQGNNLTQEDNAPSSSQAENSHQGDSTPSALQAKNPDQGNGIPLTSQTEILNQGDSTPLAENLKQRDSNPSVIGDRVQVNTNKGNADIKVKNDRTSELDAGNLHESDEDYRTTEKERQYAVTKTKLSLLGTQVTDNANRQIEEGATYSEHSHIPFSFNQSQADFTVIEYQLEQVIDKILNDSTLHENKEEWKKNAKKEIMVFLLSIVKDETLSHRTFHPCVTHSMPIQIFDSDIHVAATSRKGVEEANAGERLSFSAHTRPLDSSNYTSKPNGNEKCQQVPSGQRASDSPGKVNSKSLLGTSRKDAEGARAGERLTASAHTRPCGPEFLHIQMNEGQETAGSEKFEISVYKHSGKSLKYIIQITCNRDNFYKLKFIFNNRDMIRNLADMLIEMNYTLKCGMQEIYLESKSVFKNPDNIRDEIQGVISTLLDINNIHVLCTPISVLDEILFEKYQKDNPDCRGGNISIYLEDLCLWIVGQNEEELKNVKKSITSKNLVPEGQIPELTKTWSNSKDALNADKVVTSQPEPIKNFTDTTLPNTKDKEKMCKHNVHFVLDPGRKLKDEEWGLEIECASPDFYKFLFSFSNENLTSFAKKEFQNMKISLSQTFSHHLGITCPCIKPCDQRKLDHFIIRAVVSVYYALLPSVHLTKVTIHPDLTFEQIKTFCFSRHDAFKKHTVQLFYNEKRSDEVWIAVENDVQDLGSAVVRDLLTEKKATTITQEWENYNLSGYFMQSAALNEMDGLFLNLMKERYRDVNISSDRKRALLYGQQEIDMNFFEKMREDILALRKVRCSHPILSPSLKTLLTYQESLDFIDQTAHAKHSEPFFWTVIKQQGKPNLLEVYALNTSSANSALRILFGCLKQREFDDAHLHKDAFKFPVLKGDKFRGKIASIGMKNKTVQIAGTEDIFDEYIDILNNESIRLKKPVCKTVSVSSSNILSYCETHYQDYFKKWTQYVDIETIVGTNGTCCYTIKGPCQNLEKIEEIANELKQIISDIREIQFEVEENDIMNMSKTAEFRKQRCEVEKEWSVDTLVEGIPGQEWSTEDGFEWRFENGPSFTLLILKSALPTETDVVLQPFRKDNIPGKQQRNIQNPFSRNWHKLEFEAEYGNIGKAKESLRESLKTTLLSDVKGNQFQTLVFPAEQKIMEKIGWSIKQYLKQILVVLQEDFISEPWSLYFLCGTKDELKTCAEILETNFTERNISKTDVKIKSFPIEENYRPAITVEVRQGSLVETKADVMVNTTNKDLKSLKQGRVSKSILDAAGSELSTECRNKYPRGIEYCEVAVTPSFQLKQCKKIYHGGIPFFNKSLTPLKDFVWNCLLQATRDNMQTIAFPAIGTGILKYPKEDVAEAMINTVHEFSDKCPTTLQSVFFVIFDDATLQEFKIRSTAKQTDAASNTQTPSVSRKVKITVVGIPDKAEAASNCLHAFIENFKKKKEDGNTRKQDGAIQPSKSAENKGIEKSITDKEASSSSKLGNERENVSVHGESLRLILVKTASETDPNLTMSECRKHLNGIQYKKIICPFENTYSALVKFETQKDVDQVLSNQTSANYAFKNLPEEAVNNVKAKLSKDIIHVLKTKDVTEEEIENASGASLDKTEWFITGHLLEIKQAGEFLKQIMSRDTEQRTSLDPTSLSNKIHEAPKTDVHEKKKMYCSVSEWKAARHFYQDVLSRLYCAPDPDGLRYLLIGKTEALDEFSHALSSIFKMTLNNINQVMFECAAKNTGVYCHFVVKQCTLEIFAKSQERLEFIKTSLANFNKRGSGKANSFDKKQSESQDDESITTGDDKNVENDEHLEMAADDFDTICHFYKEFSEKIKRYDKKDHIILTGPKSVMKKILIAQKDIKDNFFNEILVLDARGISRVHDVYTQMTETEKDVHVRIGKSGSNNTVLFTGLNEQEVLKMKSWFKDELDKKDKTSGKKPDGKKVHSSSSQKDCLVYQQRKCKVYSLEEDIFQVVAYAIVCPATLLVGNDIKKKAGLHENIIDDRADATSVTHAPELDTCTVLIHTNVPRWSDYGGKNNPCEDCIQDIGFVVERCLNVTSDFSSVAFPEFVSDKHCQLPALVCCMGFAKGVQRYLKDHPNSNLNIYYVDNNPITTNLLKRCFKQDVNWEYTADNEHSIFFLHCKFQVHVKKGDVFNSRAHAIAASQDPDMKNERFVANHLYKMNDTTYKSELKGRKLYSRPIITTAPRQCSCVNVIHFVSPNWRNMKSRRSEQLKKYFESIQTLLNFASREIASVVIPLSGGHFTDWETKKEIAKSTAKAVAEWCKENAKSSQKLETIYFLHDDSSYIKELIECWRQHPCLKEQLFVFPPTSTYSTPV